MKIEYDPAIDLLNLRFLPDEPISGSIEVDEVIFDYVGDR